MKNNNNQGGISLGFIAGIAAGALAVLAWNKRDLIIGEVEQRAKQGKEAVKEAYECTKAQVSSLANRLKDEPQAQEATSANEQA